MLPVPSDDIAKYASVPEHEPYLSTERYENPHVLDRRLFARPQEDCLPICRWLRDEAPVYRDERGDAWCLSRYDDVVWASKSTDLFSSAGGTRPNLPTNPSMINQDEPRHGVLRRFISKGFTPNQLAVQADAIRGIATRLIDGIAARGECDFVQEVAAPLPLAMIGRFLGTPEEDLPRLGHWSDVMTLGSDSLDESTIGETTQAFVEYSQYMNALCERKRREPGDDLISILVHAEIDGERLSGDQLVHETLLLLVGGSETSRNVMGGAMEMLSRHPEQKQVLVDRPDRLPVAVEEFIRWVTPILNMKRTARCDVERHDVEIREGDQVVLLYPAANFDERVFEAPERFDTARANNHHVAFGIGVHFCLGASLARLQIRILYEELLRRLPDIRMVPGSVPDYPPSAFVRGFLHLPVEFTPERR
jgi:cytochrome P450 family 142 subfamily A polypeptide 1